MSRRRSRGSLPGARRISGAGLPVVTPGPFCTYCSRSLFAELRHIRCAESACKDARFCVDCFSVGAALDPHAADHPYAVAEQLDRPLFAPDWNPHDELRLLDAIATHGPDNWAAVGAAVGRSARKCETHYRAVYLDSETAPLPSDELLRAPPPASRKRSRDTPSPSPSPCPSPMPVLTGVAKKAPVLRKGAMDESGGIEDHAEDFIADIEIREDDSAEEVGLKTRLLEMYNERLVLREAVKKYIEDNGPGSFSKAMANTKKSKRVTREEREFLAGLQVFEKVFTRVQMRTFEKAAISGLRIGKELDKLLVQQAPSEVTDTNMEDVAGDNDDGKKDEPNFFDGSDDEHVADAVVATPKRRGRKPKAKARKSGDQVMRARKAGGPLANGPVEVQSIIPTNTNKGDFAYIILKSVNSLT